MLTRAGMLRRFGELVRICGEIDRPIARQLAKEMGPLLEQIAKAQSQRELLRLNSEILALAQRMEAALGELHRIERQAAN